jgi:hypothetical protein
MAVVTVHKIQRRPRRSLLEPLVDDDKGAWRFVPSIGEEEGELRDTQTRGVVVGFGT